MCEGIAAEFEGIEFGDKRLNKRSVTILEALAADPEASINGSIESWGDTLAAYRFFRNANVQPEEILRPHREATERRLREHPVVLVREVNGPGDKTEVSWLLMTSLPIESAQDVLRVVDYYVARWTVEIYFRALKTGCRVERIQLETLHRVKNCLAFYKIIAWRILYLTYLNRTTPELPCTAVFDDCEWKSVWKVTKKTPLPKKPPTLGEFMPLLTSLGGYNNRPNERPAGPQVFWTAIRRMLDFAIAWVNFGPETQVVYK